MDEDGTIWGALTVMSGRTETLPGEAERAEITHKVTIREASLPEICRGMYFVVRGLRLDGRLRTRRRGQPCGLRVLGHDVASYAQGYLIRRTSLDGR